MKLIQNVHVYAPEDMGLQDIFVEGEKISLIGKNLRDLASLDMVEKIDGTGLIAIPGLIDLHEHITGGGGEGGFATRCPEAKFSELVQAGVTSVVGLLGTDGITRTLANLLAKTREFNVEGLSAWCLCGSYGYPSVTVTDSVEKDIVLLPEVIGVKTAVSDHRSSDPTARDLIILGTQARRAGMLSGKAGFVTVHMGSGKKGLKPLVEAVEESDLPIRTFLPTHMSRKESLLEEGIEWMKRGGYMDITAGTDEASFVETAGVVRKVLAETDGSGLTMTSDAYGSQPVFDEKGNLLGITYVKPDTLLKEMRELGKEGVPFEKAVSLLTCNPAGVIHMESRKGSLKVGLDADILLLNEKYELRSVLSRGNILMRNGMLMKRGTFEG